jgi:hypothetical protein
MKKFLLLISFSFFIHTLSFAQKKPVFPAKCTSYSRILPFFTKNGFTEGKELESLEKLNDIDFNDVETTTTTNNINKILSDFRNLGIDSIPAYEEDSNKNKLICGVAKAIHSHFINHPEELCKKGQEEAYKKYSGGSTCSAYILDNINSLIKLDTTDKNVFTEINSKIEKLEKDNLLLLIGIGVVSILSIISLLVAVLKKGKRRKQSTSKEDSNESSGNNVDLTISPASINKLFKQRTFDENLQEWLRGKGYHIGNKETGYSEQEIINLIKEYDRDNTNQSKEREQQQKKPIDYTIQYSGIPQRGEFSDREMKDDFKGGMTFYEIRINKRNSFEAEFTLVEDKETQRRAMDVADTYLKPACELKGTGDIKNARSITKITSGKITKSGVNWKITKKAIIEYV